MGLNAAVHESAELGGYPLHAGWNCWIPGVVQGDAGFQSGVASPGACASACNSAGSWWVGFVFMHCQNKCWLRGAGVTCVTGQQAQCLWDHQSPLIVDRSTTGEMYRSLDGLRK